MNTLRSLWMALLILPLTALADAEHGAHCALNQRRSSGPK